MKSSYIALLIFIVFSINVFAKDIYLNLSCDRDKMEINESAVLTLKAENFSGDMSEIKINGIDNFEIVSRGTSKEMQIINGEVSSSQTIQLGIMPKKPGIFKLTATVDLKKQLKNSNTVEITVNRTNQNSSLDNQKLNENQKITEIGDKSFIDSPKIKKSYYFGEKIPLLYDFYTDRQIYEGGFTENPELSGFITKDLKNQEPIETTYGNKRYLKYNLKRAIMTPVKTGKIIINSFKFQANQLSDNGFLGANFYFTPKLQINIKELPPNKPDDFSGVVGKFSIEQDGMPSKIRLGDSITLNIKLKGSANFDQIEKLPINESDEYKIYQNEKGSMEDIVNGSYYSEKKFEVVLIPKKSGIITIPDIKIPYFDVETGSYNYEIIKGSSLIVEKNSEINENNLKKNIDRTERVENSNNVKIELVNEKESNKKAVLKIVLLVFGIIALVLITVALTAIIIKKIRAYKSKNDDSLYKKIWK